MTGCSPPRAIAPGIRSEANGDPAPRRRKTGDNRFYERAIPIADALYDAYIDEIRKEGLIP